MKRLTRYFVVLMSILTNYAFAQGPYEGDGHGYSTIFTQRSNNIQYGVDGLTTALFGDFKEASKYLQYEVELQHGVKVKVDQLAVRKEIRANLATALGTTFYANNPGRYTISAPHTFDTQSEEFKEYCKHHKDSYMTVDGYGTITPHYDGSIMAAYATKTKQSRTIVTITDTVTGTTADVFIDCFNITFPTEYYGPGPTPPPTPGRRDTTIVTYKTVIQQLPAPPTFKCSLYFWSDEQKVKRGSAIQLFYKSSGSRYLKLSYKEGNSDKIDIIQSGIPALRVNDTGRMSVVVRKTTTFFMTTSCGTEQQIKIRAPSGFVRNLWWEIPVGLGLGYLGYDLLKGHESNLNNNWVHDSNTSPYAPGSGGNVPNGPTFGSVRRTFNLGYAIHIGH